jgi:hypothetical protein
MLNNSEKFLIRKSILELAKTGMPRSNSIDDDIRYNNQNKNIYNTVNLWDCVTALGAQLSRPSYDPYRETINLDTTIGRNSSYKVNLTIPLLIYENMLFSNDILEVIHRTLNRLAEEGNVLGFISENEIKNKTPDNKRKYPWFKKIPSNTTANQLKSYKIDSPQGIVLEYEDNNTIEVLKNLRKEFGYPILVDISAIFPNHINEILDIDVDGIVIDTEKVKKLNKIYKNKHAIAVIHDARNALNEYSKKVNNRNEFNLYQDYNNNNNNNNYYNDSYHRTPDATLVIAGDVNTTGKIIKSVALGADLIGYSTSMLIAYAEFFSDRIFDIDLITERVYRHMVATKDEIKGIPAALGYSNFHNLTSSDLRTSSIEASLQGDILLEGVEKTYYQIINEILDEYIRENGIQISLEEEKEILESLMRY